MVFLKEFFNKMLMSKKASKINQGAKMINKHKTFVGFTLNYHKGLKRDSHFKRNGLLDQYAIVHQLADDILTLFLEIK